MAIHYQGLDPRTSQRAMNRALKTAYQVVGMYWVDKLRPKRFTAAGARELNYAPRQGEQSGIGRKRFFKSYTGRKKRKYGHVRPLVYTGQTERASRASRLRASARTVRIGIPADRLRKNPKSKTDPRAEIVRVSPAEIAAITRLFDVTLERNLNADRGRTRKRLK